MKIRKKSKGWTKWFNLYMYERNHIRKRFPFFLDIELKKMQWIRRKAGRDGRIANVSNPIRYPIKHLQEEES